MGGSLVSFSARLEPGMYLIAHSNTARVYTMYSLWLGNFRFVFCAVGEPSDTLGLTPGYPEINMYCGLNLHTWPRRTQHITYKSHLRRIETPLSEEGLMLSSWPRAHWTPHRSIHRLQSMAAQCQLASLAMFLGSARRSTQRPHLNVNC
jgi:hypothetical protein